MLLLITTVKRFRDVLLEPRVPTGMVFASLVLVGGAVCLLVRGPLVRPGSSSVGWERDVLLSPHDLQFGDGYCCVQPKGLQLKNAESWGSLSTNTSTSASRPIPNPNDTFAQFRKQAKEKEERVSISQQCHHTVLIPFCYAWHAYITQVFVLCHGRGIWLRCHSVVCCVWRYHTNALE